MPIKAYVGQMRSGKSYEVVSNVILNGLRDGRRVVSNIAGLNYDAMRELLLADGVPIENIGQLVCVAHEEVEKPSFWRTDKDEAAGFNSFIQPGDLVALDEVWRFFKKRGDVEPRAMNFMRMHGHMTHPTKGFICEIALISQLITDINENIRGVIQETYRMTKLTAVGSDKSYRVDIFSGGSVQKSSFLRQLMRRYDPKFFPLYSSHSQKTGVDAVEKNIDSRANILSGALFKIGLPLLLLVGIGAVWTVYSFFKPAPPKDEKKDVVSTTSSAAARGLPKEPRKNDDLDETWRAVGWYQTATKEVAYLLEDNKGRVRTLFDPPGHKIHGWQISIKTPEGTDVTTYSGGGAIESGIVGGKP